MSVRYHDETDEFFAKRRGYRVELTHWGWIIFSPGEVDLRLDGPRGPRQKFQSDREAWRVAAIRAERNEKRKAARRK